MKKINKKTFRNIIFKLIVILIIFLMIFSVFVVVLR